MRSLYISGHIIRRSALFASTGAPGGACIPNENDACMCCGSRYRVNAHSLLYISSQGWRMKHLFASYMYACIECSAKGDLNINRSDIVFIAFAFVFVQIGVLAHP